jgi:uncharacterized membrane protein YbaN (DUF454 family)
MRDFLRQPEVDVADLAPTQKASIVRSSPGRLRVHLPQWSGKRDVELVARLRQLPGVTHAEASSVTGNILVLFRPQQVSEQALLEVLPRLRLEPLTLAAQPRTVAGSAEVVAVSEVRVTRVRKVEYATGLRRLLYQGLGWASVGMAIVGFIVPGIPGAPFVILAGYFFIRSSPESHEWLRQSRWFGPILRDWEDHRAVRPVVRNIALAIVIISMAANLAVGLPPLATASIFTIQVAILILILRLKVVRPALEHNS